MGVVYEAEDIRLGRTVALKFISPDFGDRGLDRFRREARLASWLSHPNICAVYDIGEHEGQSFIVMELLEGQTVFELVQAGPLPARQLLELAIQAASALDLAHSKGVLHRDIKAGNLFVTANGLKVLDFGLAKFVPLPETEPDTHDGLTKSHAVAMGSELTVAGVAGTVSYMSPEQASGLPLDARTDLFSFGVVLYFMATGKLPFRGNTSALVFTALLVKEPTRPEIENPSLPPGLQAIILKALEKDPERRYQSAREMLTDLQQVQQQVISGSSQTLSARLPRQLRSPWLMVPFALAGLIVAAVAGYWYTHLAPPRQAPFTRITLRRLTDSGGASQVAISPDGRYVVYVEQSSGLPALWIRQVQQESDLQIIPPADVAYDGTAYSPDGNSIYFLRHQADRQGPDEIYQIPALGGRPRLVVSNAASAPAFSPDGQRIAFLRNVSATEQQLMVTNSDGSGATVLVPGDRLQGEFRNVYNGPSPAPAWSPDGKTIALGIKSSHAGLFENVNAAILQVDVATGQTKELVVRNHSIGRLAWLPDSSQMLVAGFDLATHDLRGQISVFDSVTGTVRRVTADLSNYRLTDLSVTATGDNLAAVEEERQEHLWMAPQGDFSRAREITTGSRSWEQGFALLGGGRILAADSNFDLSLMNDDGSDAQPFVIDTHPQWAPTPCGTAVAFVRFAAMDDSQLWLAQKDGTGARRLAAGRMGNPTCTPDGQWVVVNHPDGQFRPSLFKISPAGVPVQLLAQRSFPSAVSPDGKRIGVVLSNPEGAGAQHLAVLPIEGGEPQVIARNIEFDNSFLRWTADGRAMAYVLTRQGVSNIWRQPIAGGEPTQLTHFTSEVISDVHWTGNGDAWFSRGPVSRNVVLIAEAH